MDVVLDLSAYVGIHQECIDTDISSWLKVLLRLVDIAGCNSSLYLDMFINSEERVTMQYRYIIEEYVSEG